MWCTGKSTLIAFTLRFYDPENGQVGPSLSNFKILLSHSNSYTRLNVVNHLLGSLTPIFVSHQNDGRISPLSCFNCADSGPPLILSLIFSVWETLPQVLLDGQDLTTINVHSLRSNISYVGQVGGAHK